jgi:hypothetical protein
MASGLFGFVRGSVGDAYYDPNYGGCGNHGDWDADEHHLRFRIRPKFGKYK